LGTILAGRRAGYPQAVIMVAGFVLVMGYMILYLAAVVDYLRHPSWTEAEFHALYRPYGWALWSGLICCVTAWLWALGSTLALWKGENSAKAEAGGEGPA